MADQAQPKDAYTSSDVYARLVSRISEMEKTATRPDTAYVNITSIFSVGQKPPPRPYADLLKAIDEIESKKPAAKEAPRERGPIAAVPVSARSQENDERQEPRETVETAEYPGLQEAMAGVQEAEEAKPSRLSRLASIGRTKARIDTSKLVLPNLQLSDQITEIERIIDGLKQGAFDKEHVQVVIEEVYGLKQAVDDQKKDRRGHAKAMTSAEQALWNMRDKRIANAIILLQKGGK